MTGPENRDVGSGAGPNCVRCGACDSLLLVTSASAAQIPCRTHSGRPVGVAAEQRIIIRGAQEADNAKLLHQLIPEFLRAAFVEKAALQIAFDWRCSRNVEIRPIDIAAPLASLMAPR